MSSAVDYLRLDSQMSEVEVVRCNQGRVALFCSGDPTRERTNEDSILVLERGSALVLAVADGGGGGPSGHKASSLALSEVRAALLRDESLREAILWGIEVANEAILALGTGSFTTLSIAAIEEGSLQTYQVGDSGIVALGQRGKVKEKTIAHSPVGYAVEAGWIDEDEAMHHDDRHVVSNVLGQDSMKVELGARRELSPRDRVVLGSDGLFDNLPFAEIVSTIRCRDLLSQTGALVRRCQEQMLTPAPGTAAKPDDLSVVVFQPS